MQIRRIAPISALVFAGLLAGSIPGASAQDHQALKPRKSSPKPEILYGPPLPPERAALVQQVHPLTLALQDGRMTLTNPMRESEQLHRLEVSGLYLWPPPKPTAPKSRTAASKKEAKPPDVRPADGASGEKAILPPDAAEENIARIPASGRTSGTAASRHAPPDIRVVGEENEPGVEAAAPPGSVEPSWVYTPPSPALFQMLNTLASHSTPAHPLELMSLLRPPYQTGYFRHAGPRNPHSLGLAADIGAYKGHRVRLNDPEECVAIVLALLRDLPPGRYRMGVPKAPEAPLVVGRPPIPAGLAALLAELAPDQPLITLFPVLPAFSAMPDPLPSRSRRRQNVSNSGANTPVNTPLAADSEVHPAVGIALGLYAGLPRKVWPFFPPPEPELENGLIAPLRQNGRVVPDSAGHPQPHIVRFRNEGYAPAEALGDSRVRKALDAARKRGVDVFALFPDSADHIHLDVRRQP